MADRDDIIRHLDTYLAVDAIDDYCPKGLQVAGAETVTRVVCGVSACMPLFERAVAADAQMVLVHHGMFWDNESRVVQGSLKDRLKFLLANDLSLVAYHLPLDCHPQIGNNACIADRLGLVDRTDFGRYRGRYIALMGNLPAPMAFDDFLTQVNRVFGGDAFHLPFGPGTVRTVALCSGGAPELVREAVARRADVYLTGEATEYVYHLSREERIHYVAAGHHRTEMFGIQALGDHLEQKFGVGSQFVDIHNPI